MSLAYSATTIATGIGGIAMGHFSDRVPIRMHRNPGLAIGFVSAGGALGQDVVPFSPATWC